MWASVWGRLGYIISRSCSSFSVGIPYVPFSQSGHPLASAIRSDGAQVLETPQAVQSVMAGSQEGEEPESAAESSESGGVLKRPAAKATRDRSQTHQWNEAKKAQDNP